MACLELSVVRWIYFSSRTPEHTNSIQVGWEFTVGYMHKVITYIEYRAVSGVFRTIDPSPPLHPASVSSPHTKGRAERGWGVNISEDARHWASYSIIPLRLFGVFAAVRGFLWCWDLPVMNYTVYCTYICI